MITLSDQIYLSLLLPLDTRLSNVLIDGNTVVVENFNDYFTRVDLGSRYLGMEVNIVSPFGVYEINNFLNKVQNKELVSKKYGFLESTSNSDLVEINYAPDIDSELSLTSTNPVENKVITEVIDDLYSKVGESEIIDVSDAPIYNPVREGGYLAGEFVSYINLSSPDPKYQVYAIYLAQENIPMGQSPEVNSDWEWQGTELEVSNRNTSMIMANNIDAIEKITGYKQSDGIIDKSTGILYRYNQTSTLLPSLLTIRPLDKEESDPGRWIAQMFLKQSEKFDSIQISDVDYIELYPNWDYFTTISFSDLVFGDLTLDLIIQNPLLVNVKNHMTICIDNKLNVESVHLNILTSWTVNWKGNSPLVTIPGGKTCFIKVDSLQNNNYIIEYDFINDTNHEKYTGQAERTIGGITEGQTFINSSMSEMWDTLIKQEKFPILTPPSSTFTTSITGLREVGEIININFNSTFNRGNINPQYTALSPFRSGLPSEYLYSGNGLTNRVKTDLVDTQDIIGYVVLINGQSWTGRVAYSSGIQPKSSYDNNFDTPLSAGITSNITRTITGVYPFFATTSSLNTLTKQVLQNHGSVITKAFVEEDGISKQKLEVPLIWGTISKLEQFNTLSGQWDTIDSESFTSATVNRNINGNNVEYRLYTHSGGTIGQRQLRFTF